jgi:hypothetical protein
MLEQPVNATPAARIVASQMVCFMITSSSTDEARRLAPRPESRNAYAHSSRACFPFV